MEKGILEAILARLQTITIENGYHTDVGLKASYFDPYQAEYGGDPKVTFRDTDDDSEKENLYHAIKLQIEVEAIAFTSESTKLADSCNLVDDLVRCLVRDRAWHPAGVIAVRRKGRNKVIGGGGKQAIAVTLNIEVEYRELI